VAIHYWRKKKSTEVWIEIIHLPGPCGGSYTILRTDNELSAHIKYCVVSNLWDCVGGVDDKEDWEEVKKL